MELDVLGLQNIDNVSILDAAYQLKHICLAFESIRAMYDENVVALPLHIDSDSILWCTTIETKRSLEVFVVATSYKSEVAGESTTLATKRIKVSPSVRKIIKSRMRELSKDCELDKKIQNLLNVIPKLNIPESMELWLNNVRIAI